MTVSRFPKAKSLFEIYPDTCLNTGLKSKLSFSTFEYSNWGAWHIISPTAETVTVIVESEKGELCDFPSEIKQLCNIANAATQIM